MGAVSRPKTQGGRGGRGRAPALRGVTSRDTAPQFRADLSYLGLSQFADRLREEGIERACDLCYLQDDELIQLGINPACVHKMLEIVANGANASGPSPLAISEPPQQQHQRCGPGGGGSSNDVRARVAATQQKLTPEQLLEKVRMVKKVGNQMMKAADLHGSAKMYKHGISMVEQLLKQSFTDPGLQKNVLEMYTALQINAAHVCFKQTDYEACIHHAQKVLEFEPNNAPALYRRGQALAMLNNENDLQWACNDLKRVVMNDRGNHFAQHQLMQCQLRLHDHFMNDRGNHLAAQQFLDEDTLSMRDTTYLSSKSSTTADSVGTPPTDSPRGCMPQWPIGSSDPHKLALPGITMNELAAMIGSPPGLDLPAGKDFHAPVGRPCGYQSDPVYWPTFNAVHSQVSLLL